MNPVEIGLSFLEGLALIASPCILPVLPLVLGASVDGGKKRPFGIITGFVLAFTAFALLSRQLVGWLGINLDWIKYGSLVFLAAFALILLVKPLSDQFNRLTQGFAASGEALSSRLTNRAGQGFGSGLVIGMMIGLIWTPCAGPILAAVLVQIIRQQSDLAALSMVLAFAIGAGLPMLLIALTGRTLMNKLGFLKKHAGQMRQGFGLLMLAAVGFMAFGGDATALFSSATSSRASTQTASLNQDANSLKDALPNPYPAPELTGLQAWLNTQEPLTLASLKGKVVLIDFWTYSCINCVRTLPYVTAWDQAYRDKGLVIIGVHAPEFEFEKNINNVKKALTQHNIQYPVALDNNFDTWTAFKNRYWPAHYLINQEGQVVYTHLGEGNYQQTEHNIRLLLGVEKKAASLPEKPAFSDNQTPETYLGQGRAQYFSSPQGLTKATPSFTWPGFIPADHWALAGEWQVGEDNITSTKPGAQLRLNFNAAKVFLVLGTRDGTPVKASLTLNGAPLTKEQAGKDIDQAGVLTVEGHQLYHLVSLEKPQNALLEITAENPGLEAYAFTFGQ